MGVIWNFEGKFSIWSPCKLWTKPRTQGQTEIGSYVHTDQHKNPNLLESYAESCYWQRGPGKGQVVSNLFLAAEPSVQNLEVLPYKIGQTGTSQELHRSLDMTVPKRARCSSFKCHNLIRLFIHQKAKLSQQSRHCQLVPSGRKVSLEPHSQLYTANAAAMRNQKGPMLSAVLVSINNSRVKHSLEI